MLKRFTVLTTFPGERGSGNVGDQLIEHSLKQLLELESGEVEFLTIFREDPLEPYLEEINRTQAILLPGFAIRDTPLYPDCYRLTENLEAIEVPLISVGANWNVYPGDLVSRGEITYSDRTMQILKAIAKQHPVLSCRELTLCEVLARHGIHNTLMTGDPAWYDPACFGKPMRQPEKVRRLLFSPPMSPFFVDQAGDVLQMLAKTFPDSQRICAMHCSDSRTKPVVKDPPPNDASMSDAVAEKNARIRQLAQDSGFEVREVSGDVNKLQFYSEMDLHVGYECHAHVSFFRNRIPSVLIAEDARGMGFNETFGVGGFTGFQRCQTDRTDVRHSGGTSGYCVSLEEYEIAPADPTVVPRIAKFLLEEEESHFNRYQKVSNFIDDTYRQKMAPFLRSLP